MIPRPQFEAPPVPITPDAEAWRAMSAAQRATFHEEVISALQRQADLAPEGRPHSVARMSATATLSDFYDRVGRAMYLASDLPVDYPGEAPFAPDLIAVADVEDPGADDTRMAWVVADEGRGIDLALEILYAGDRHKDLVENLTRFARLGIPEYFVYDRMHQRLYGFHLPIIQTGRYQSIPQRHGLLHSRVLDLDLGIVGGRLRFFYGDAEVPESRELIARLDALMNDRETQLAELTQALEEERQLRGEAERRREEEQRLREEEQRLRLAAEAELAELRRRLTEP